MTVITEKIESIEAQLAELREAKENHQTQAKYLLKEITTSFNAKHDVQHIIQRTNDFKYQMQKVSECDAKGNMLVSQLSFLRAIETK